MGLGAGYPHGGDIFNLTEEKITVTSDTTTSVFDQDGILLRLVVDKAVDGAAATFTNAAGTSIGLAPDLDVKGTLAYGLILHSGCKIVTTGFTGGVLHLFIKSWMR